MEEINLPVSREYQVGKKITIVRDIQQGTFSLSDGFLHSDMLFPSQIDIIEFQSEAPIKIRIESRLLHSVPNETESVNIQSPVKEISVPNGYRHIFSSKARKRAKDGTLGIYEYSYNTNYDAWFAQVLREDSSDVFNNNHRHKMFLGSLNRPDDKLGKLLLHIEGNYSGKEFIQKQIQKINGTTIDSQFVKSALDILEHEGYLSHKRSMRKPWTDEFRRTEKPLPHSLIKRAEEIESKRRMVVTNSG